MATSHQPLLEIFRALGDPTRMRIVHLLRAMELSVGEVAQVVSQSQPRVSRHIRILAEAGLIERRKEGNWVFLRLGSSPFCRQLMPLFDRIDPTESEALWLKADLARLAAVRADRARAADEYFARHAEEWDALRSLHIADAHVEAAMLRLAGVRDVKRSLGRFLDIGTGTGRMIALFDRAADHVTAVDRSPDMLRLARSKLPGGSGEKYELLLGDCAQLPLGDASVDFVTIHQVLHYVQAPDVAIVEAARVLAPGGSVLIVDFAPHEMEELRQRDQHTRLGFSDEQMQGWMNAAGLTLEAVEALPGENLTIKLWLGRRDDAVIRPIREKQKA